MCIYTHICVCVCVCILLYQNFQATVNQKPAIDTQIRKINSNTTLKIVIKPQEEREEGKKKEQQKQIQSN